MCCFHAVEHHELFVNFEDEYLSIILLANIFSQSIDCLFVLFIVSFALHLNLFVYLEAN